MEVCNWRRQLEPKLGPKTETRPYNISGCAFDAETRLLHQPSTVNRLIFASFTVLLTLWSTKGSSTLCGMGLYYLASHMYNSFSEVLDPTASDGAFSDEAHECQNSETKTVESTWTIKEIHRLFITGTPARVWCLKPILIPWPKTWLHISELHSRFVFSVQVPWPQLPRNRWPQSSIWKYANQAIFMR